MRRPSPKGSAPPGSPAKLANSQNPDAAAGTLTCPKCGHSQKMEIPADRCVHFYTCEGCKALIECKGCCVFCDYGDRPCPAAVVD